MAQTSTSRKLTLGLSLVTCATGPETKEETPAGCIAKHTLIGAGIGALGGAVIGAILKGGKGAGAGAAGGAVAGGALGFAYAWGKCFDKFSTIKSEKIKDYDETVGDVNYRKEDGTKVKITNASLDPTTVKPGETVIFNAQYYALDPIKERDLQIKETRILKVYNEEKKEFVEVGRVPNDITVSPGLRRADGMFQIHDQTPDGKYLIGFEVNCAGKVDTAEMPLTIKKI